MGGVANSTVPTSPVVTTIEVAAQATGSGSALPLPLPASLQSSAVVETAEDPLDNIHIEQHSMLFLSMAFIKYSYLNRVLIFH